jgi:hypothetical protein
VKELKTVRKEKSTCLINTSLEGGMIVVSDPDPDFGGFGRSEFSLAR